MSIKFCPRYEIQLVRNGSERYRVEKHGKIQCTDDARRIIADIVRASMENSPCEIVGVVTLDTKSVPIGFSIVTQGTLDSSLVHPREVFRLAIAQNAASLILVHNHPSGDLTPSEHDLGVTARLKECGHMLGIAVLDHIIVAMTANGEWESLSILEHEDKVCKQH